MENGTRVRYMGLGLAAHGQEGVITEQAEESGLVFVDFGDGDELHAETDLEVIE